MLMILSSVVLLIACANIANLMLARATTRRAEIAIRMAIGAGRSDHHPPDSCRKRGVELYWGARRASRCLCRLPYHSCPRISRCQKSARRRQSIASGSWFCVSGFVGHGHSVWRGTGLALVSCAAGRGTARNESQRRIDARPLLAATEGVGGFPGCALVVLLAGAILVTRSLVNLEHQNFGIATANRYVLHFDPAGAGYAGDRLPPLNREIEDRFSALPGVSSVGLGMYSPLEGDNWGECVIQQGHPAPRPGDDCGSTWDKVSKSFLDSIGVPIVRGRDFTEQDTATSPQVAIVNQTFAKHFYPNQDPIGQHFGIDFPQYSASFEIVGVFRDFKMNNPKEVIRPVFLRPVTQFMSYKEPEMISTEVQSMFMTSMVIDFSAPQSNVDTLVRRTLAGIDPNLTVSDLRSLNTQVAGNFTQERLIARLSSLFGVLALILASVGLYGVMSYFVARRTAEIGIRMALGATRKSVVAMVMRGALWQIVIGLGLGIPAALFAGHLMASQLYEIKGYDPLAFAVAVVVLGICSAFAGFIPARRAASVEPMKALRIE